VAKVVGSEVEARVEVVREEATEVEATVVVMVVVGTVVVRAEATEAVAMVEAQVEAKVSCCTIATLQK
jgi:hypothetical protein